MDEVQLLQATDKSSRYSFDQTQKEEKQSQPWGHPVVLNSGHSPFSPQKDGEEWTSKVEHRTMRIQYLHH